VEIKDNFLNEKYFQQIKDTLLGDNFPYYYNHSLNKEQKNFDDYYFTHKIYADGKSKSGFFEHLQPMLNKINPKTIIKMKVNFYPRSSKIIEHSKHCDLDYPHKGFILYINTCDGYTLLDNGQKIESIANRALFFDSSKPHASTTSTNVHGRVNINMIYF
jgi:hypothetical protein